MLFLDLTSTCKDIFPIVSIIKNGVIPLIQIAIPIILIVLGMLDLGKAVIASKEDEIKAAQKLLIKRIIYAVAIFLVVFIVTVIFNMVKDNSEGDAANWRTCWDCKYVPQGNKKVVECK